MSKVKAIVQKVVMRDTANGPRILITMKNNDQKWVARSYVDKILASNFMEGGKPTLLEGATVSYERITHKQGDAVIDEKTRNPITPAATHSKDGYNLWAFDVEEFGEKAEKYDTLHTKAAIKLQLKGSLSSLISNATKSSTVSAPVAELVDEEVGVESGDDTL